jgi:hypothetical protein
MKEQGRRNYQNIEEGATKSQYNYMTVHIFIVHKIITVKMYTCSFLRRCDLNAQISTVMFEMLKTCGFAAGDVN